MSGKGRSLWTSNGSTGPTTLQFRVKEVKSGCRLQVTCPLTFSTWDISKVCLPPNTCCKH